MLNLILFGPPGSGKGTQADRLVDHYGLIHISTGDLFRSELRDETELGRKAKKFMDEGQLVPDEITIGMLKNRIDQSPGADGYIFDGFPRTVAQAKALDDLLEERNTAITGLVALDVPDREIIDRILLRGKTSGRSDDNDEEIVRNRIEVYKKETTPVFDHYAQTGKAVRVNGVGSIDQIFDRLCEAIDRLKDD